MLKPTDTEIVDNALQHYNAKLQEEMSRFGVKFCHSEMVDDVEAANLHRCVFWSDLSEDFGLHFTVFKHDSVLDGHLNILIVSEHEIPRVHGFWELWNLVSFLKMNTLIDEKTCRLTYYEGPYKIPVPSYRESCS